jgi:hypothetical protein
MFVFRRQNAGQIYEYNIKGVNVYPLKMWLS